MFDTGLIPKDDPRLKIVEAKDMLWTPDKAPALPDAPKRVRMPTKLLAAAASYAEARQRAAGRPRAAIRKRRRRAKAARKLNRSR